MLICLLSNGLTHSQTESEKNNSIKLSQKIRIGIEFGPYLSDFSKEIEKSIVTQHFDQDVEESICFLWKCFGSFDNEFPKSSSNGYFGIDASYLLKNKNEIGLRFNWNNNGYSEGNGANLGRLNINYNISSITPYYRIADSNSNLNLDIGLSAYFINISETFYLNPNTEYNSFKPGIMVGGSIGILQKKYYYLRIGGQYHAALGKVKIGPFETAFDVVDGEYLYASNFEEEKLSLHGFVVLLSLGVIL